MTEPRMEIHSHATATWELLEGEFLRKEVLINSSRDKIFEQAPLICVCFIQNLLNFIRSKEVELRSLGVSFPVEEEEHLGNTLLVQC